jgi:hypothetical protein
MAAGGRGTGSEKMFPICARAGDAAAIRPAIMKAAQPAMIRVRNISRGFVWLESGPEHCTEI